MNWTSRHTSLLFLAGLMVLPACRTRQGVPNAMTDQNNTFSLGPQGEVTHVIVKEDDTVYSIAYNHGVTTKSLILLNDIPQPYALTVGQKLDLPKPDEHIVDEGETLEGVAMLYGVSPMLLAQENGLSDRQVVTPRQRLHIPPKDLNPAVLSEDKTQEVAIASAPLAPVGPLAESPKSKRAENKLPDELAAELAREKSRDDQGTSVVAPVAGAATSLATATVSAGAVAGEGATGAAGAALTAATAPLPVKKPISLHQSKAPHAVPAKPEKAVAAAPSIPPVKEAPTFEVAKPKPAPVAAPAAEFIRPVDGKMIAKFGDKVATGKNDGINLLAPMGTPVKAAADGTVVYAGNELKGFGNLVLIKHDGGWITAYGHNSAMTVTKGQAVKQGDIIAKVGKTGDVNEPQLHFEIRKGTQPIDPLGKLGS